MARPLGLGQGARPRRASSRSPTGTRTGATTGTTTATSSSSPARTGSACSGSTCRATAVQTIRMKGFDALPPEQRALLPERVDLESAEHQRLFRAFFGVRGRAPRQHARADVPGDVPGAVRLGRGDGLERAPGPQEARRREGDHGRADRLGPRRLRPRRRAPGASCGSTGRRPRSSRPDRAKRRGRRAVAKVQASYADFVWGLPPSTDPLYPSVGISTPEQKSGERYKVIMVGKESPAEAAGFKVGDELVSIDGLAYTDKETVNRLMSEKRWGDAVVYKVMRDGQEQTLTAHLRRQPPKAEARPSRRAGGAAVRRARTARARRSRRRRRGVGRRAAPQPPAAPAAASGARAPLAEGDARPARGWLSVEDTLTRARARRGALGTSCRVPAPRRAEDHGLRAAGDRGRPPTPRRAARFFGINSGAVDLYAAGRSSATASPLPAGGGTVRLAVRGQVRLRPLGPEGGVHARLPRDGRHRLEGGRLPRRAAASGTRTSARASSSSTSRSPQPEGWHVVSAGQRHLARRERRGPLGVARGDRRDHLVGGPLVVYRDAAGAVETLVYLRQKDDALAGEVPGRRPRSTSRCTAG